MTASAETHSKRRARKAAKMRAAGVPEEAIQHWRERQIWIDLVARVGLDRARAIRYAEQADQPDDGSHRPTYVDPLLRGPARATGETARVVRSGRTVAKWQHDQRSATR